MTSKAIRKSTPTPIAQAAALLLLALLTASIPPIYQPTPNQSP
ncbi:MAG: hypothetical protein U9Q82_06535 [Chloroflexota bacterium]|nr:hypothetical protein [Chloroflexota bacterium]